MAYISCFTIGFHSQHICKRNIQSSSGNQRTKRREVIPTDCKWETPPGRGVWLRLCRGELTGQAQVSAKQSAHAVVQEHDAREEAKRALATHVTASAPSLRQPVSGRCDRVFRRYIGIRQFRVPAAHL